MLANRACNIRDETAQYLICPILLGIISDACHIDPLPSLHDLVYGNDRNDVAGALICANAYHVYHSLKLGNRNNVLKAIESNNFCKIRASAHSLAKAFDNEFGIQSKLHNSKLGNSTHSEPGLSSANTFTSSTSLVASNVLFRGTSALNS